MIGYVHGLAYHISRGKLLSFLVPQGLINKRRFGFVHKNDAGAFVNQLFKIKKLAPICLVVRFLLNLCPACTEMGCRLGADSP
jgi:hypothetical protein